MMDYAADDFAAIARRMREIRAAEHRPETDPPQSGWQNLAKSTVHPDDLAINSDVCF